MQLRSNARASHLISRAGRLHYSIRQPVVRYRAVTSRRRPAAVRGVRSADRPVRPTTTGSLETTPSLEVTPPSVHLSSTDGPVENETRVVRSRRRCIQPFPHLQSARVPRTVRRRKPPATVDTAADASRSRPLGGDAGKSSCPISEERWRNMHLAVKL